MMLLLVIGLLLYGRNLPQAGRSMGRFVAQLKRGFQDFKEQMDRDESLREVRKTFEETSREMRGLTAAPRAIADPMAALRNFAHDTVHSPADDERPGADRAHVERPADAGAGAGDDRADEPPPAAAAPPPPSSAPALPAPTSSAPAGGDAER